jgi:hypothetical protein
MAGVVGLTAACLEGPAATRGTTRACPDVADGDPICYQQCADVGALDCKATGTDGVALVECVKDAMTGEYTLVDGAFVPPDEATTCVAFLVEAGACDDEPVDLELAFVGVAEDACVDVDCAVLEPEDCE